VRTVAWLTLITLAGTGCIKKASERVDPAFKTHHFKTIAIIAGGSRGNDAFMTTRARDRVRKANVVTVVSVNGKWESEPDVKKAVCGPEQTPPLDGFVVVEGDHLTLWDCGTGKVAWEADGGYEGVDYMTNKLLEYLKTST